MISLDLRIPPVLVVLLDAAAMWAASRLAPGLHFSMPARLLLAACMGGAGVSVCLLAIASFRRAGTTVNPLRPDRSAALVASGIYGVTRNPMYLGFLLLLIGFAIYLSNLLAFLFLPIFVLYLNRFQIR